MSEREQLWYLIENYIKDKYDAQTFCDEFCRIYDHEVDYDALSEYERYEFREMSSMAARYSSNIEDLKLKNVYYNQKQIKDKALDILSNR